LTLSTFFELFFDVLSVFLCDAAASVIFFSGVFFLSLETFIAGTWVEFTFAPAIGANVGKPVAEVVWDAADVEIVVVSLSARTMPGTALSGMSLKSTLGNVGMGGGEALAASEGVERVVEVPLWVG
jgi:hypothetical protein